MDNKETNIDPVEAALNKLMHMRLDEIVDTYGTETLEWAAKHLDRITKEEREE